MNKIVVAKKIFRLCVGCKERSLNYKLFNLFKKFATALQLENADANKFLIFLKICTRFVSENVNANTFF